MRRGLALLTCATLLALGASSAARFQGGDFAAVSTRELPAGISADDALLSDHDGDGRDDLLVSGRVQGKRYARLVLVFRSTADGTLAAPQRLDLTPDVVAWAAADVHPDAGDELVLFTASSAFAWRSGAGEGERFVRLLECDFLWQLPDPGQALLVQSSVRDLDGDGWSDLVIPEPGGYRAAFQRRGEGGVSFATQSVLRVPPEAADWEGLGPELAGGAAVRGGSRGSAFSFSVTLSGEEESEGEDATLLAVVESAPAPQLVDWDGDRRLDLLVQTTERLHLWPQATPGELARDPSASFALPVKADRTRRLDASYNAQLIDLDGDRRADCAIFAGDSGSDDVRTQLLAFLSSRAGPGRAAGGARDPFGERGVPQDLLVLGGFVASAAFLDLDGDGLPELAAHTVRPDLIDQLRSAASETIDAELFVYRNAGGRFARRPELSWRYTLPLKAFEPTVKFLGDVTGDGLAELLVRDHPGRVRLLTLRAQKEGKEGWTLSERALWELSLDEDADLRLVSRRGRAAKDLVILEPARVLHARFGR